MAGRFSALKSEEAKTPSGIWSWARRLVNDLNENAAQVDRSTTIAADVSLNIGSKFAVVAGATPITTLVAQAAGTRVTLIGGVGGYTVEGGGNITMGGSAQAWGPTMEVSEGQSVSFICDGILWYVDGKSF